MCISFDYFVRFIVTTWHNLRELERINGGVSHNGQQSVAHLRVPWLVENHSTSARHFTSSIKGTKALRYVHFLNAGFTILDFTNGVCLFMYALRIEDFLTDGTG